MKTRNGFVSNSSSSSFVVRYKEPIYSQIPLLTRAQVKLLRKYGFEWDNCFLPTQVEFGNGKRISKTHPDSIDGKAWDPRYALSYGVNCNENDVLYFLFKNRIPFEAVTHYCHWSWYYKGGDTALCIKNPGLAYWARDGLTAKQAQKEAHHDLFEEINIEQWLADEAAWVEQYQKDFEEE